MPGADYATTLGAAILAGVGTGIYGSFDEAVKTTVQIRRVHSPAPDNHRIYMGYYQLYRELYENLKDSFSKLYKLAK